MTSNASDGSVLPQQFEDFIAELDKFVDEEKKKKKDLQEQVRIRASTSFCMEIYSFLALEL